MARTIQLTCLFLGAGLAASPSHVLAKPKVAKPVSLTPAFRWTLPDTEIGSVRFGLNGQVTFVARHLWPDGHLAESFSPDELERLEDRARKEPRFADPIIRVLGTDGKETCQVRYGWDPALSPDGRYLVFSSQKNAITGRRLLAETMAENDIRLHDCTTGAQTLVAEPRTGHLGGPQFLAGGERVAFSFRDAVNGAFSGSVGVGVANRAGGERRDLVAPHRTGEFWDLVGYSIAGDSIVILRAEPRPKGDDTYLADKYEYEIWRAFPEAGTHQRVGLRSHFEAAVSVGDGSVTRVPIFDGRWRSFSVADGRLVDAFSKRLPSDTKFSPELTRAVVIRASGLEVVDAKNNRSIASYRARGLVPREVAWSRDARRLAVVLQPADEDSRASDELAVLVVPP